MSGTISNSLDQFKKRMEKLEKSGDIGTSGESGCDI